MITANYRRQVRAAMRLAQLYEDISDNARAHKNSIIQIAGAQLAARTWKLAAEFIGERPLLRAILMIRAMSMYRLGRQFDQAQAIAQQYAEHLVAATAPGVRQRIREIAAGIMTPPTQEQEQEASSNDGVHRADPA